MATNLAGSVCIGQHSVCYLRVARLGTNCAPLTGADTTAITAGIVTMTATPEIEEGQLFEAKNGCNRIIWSAEDCDIVKRWNLTGQFNLFDEEMEELMFGGSLITATSGPFSGDVIGYAHPGKGAECSNGASLEVWSKVGLETATCTTASNVPVWVRHVFPRVIFTPGERVLENDVAVLNFTGKATENVAWGTGPFADVPFATAPDDTGYFWFVEEELPFDAEEDICGYRSAPGLT